MLTTRGQRKDESGSGKRTNEPASGYAEMRINHVDQEFIIIIIIIIITVGRNREKRANPETRSRINQNRVNLHYI